MWRGPPDCRRCGNAARFEPARFPRFGDAVADRATCHRTDHRRCRASVALAEGWPTTPPMIAPSTVPPARLPRAAAARPAPRSIPRAAAAAGSGRHRHRPGRRAAHRPSRSALLGRWRPGAGRGSWACTDRPDNNNVVKASGCRFFSSHLRRGPQAAHAARTHDGPVPGSSPMHSAGEIRTSKAECRLRPPGDTAPGSGCEGRYNRRQ